MDGQLNVYTNKEYYRCVLKMNYTCLYVMAYDK